MNDKAIPLYACSNSGSLGRFDMLNRWAASPTNSNGEKELLVTKYEWLTFNFRWTSVQEAKGENLDRSMFKEGRRRRWK